MIDDSDRQATADAIAELATHHQFQSRRDELADVAAAIRDPDHGHAWGGLDLVAYFSSTDDPNSTRTSWLDVVRLPLILVPILVTWFGLWDAARAHAEMRANGLEEASRPFLPLWQDGFNGYSYLTLQKVAVIDVLAISLVIVLTIIATNRERIADRADAARTANELEMAACLRRGQRALRSAEVATPADLQREFTKAVSSLARLDSAALAAERIVDGFSRLETCIAQVEANTQSFAIAATETRAVMTDFAAEVSVQLQETNRALTSHIQGLEQGIESVNLSASGLVAATNGISSSISSGLVDLNATAAGLATMADGLRASVQDLVTEDSASRQALADRIRLIQAASKAAADSEASLTAGAKQVAALADAVSRAASNLAAGSDNLDSRLSGTISDFERFLVAQLEATEQLKLMASSAGVTAKVLQEELAPLLRQRRTGL